MNPWTRIETWSAWLLAAAAAAAATTLILTGMIEDLLQMARNVPARMRRRRGPNASSR
jgi:hypothetical protein